MSTEEILSADQRKPDNLKFWHLGWLVGAALVAVMWFGNHEGRMENVWLLVVAGGIVGGVLTDIWARAKGYKK
ncbi:MAG: DUF2631 domain-containing protein [Terriglobales bacterium]